MKHNYIDEKYTTMARTPSNMLPLGTKAPDFTLRDTVNQGSISLSDVSSKSATVIMFICNHCPFVIHLHNGIRKIVDDFTAQGVSFVAINSNDVQNYPEDSPEKMTQLFRTLDLQIPYLYDESQKVAKAYDAACTPDFFVFDKDLKLAYRGQFDDSRPDNGISVTGDDLRLALRLLLKNEKPQENQKPSLGCNIKWKS